MDSSARAKLRGMANALEPVVHIGKEGITENLLTQVDQALEARELIKGAVQKNCEQDARQACHALAEALRAQPVQVIGRRFVLYRRSVENPKIEI